MFYIKYLPLSRGTSPNLTPTSLSKTHVYDLLYKNLATGFLFSLSSSFYARLLSLTFISKPRNEQGAPFRHPSLVSGSHALARVFAKALEL